VPGLGQLPCALHRLRPCLVFALQHHCLFVRLPRFIQGSKEGSPVDVAPSSHDFGTQGRVFQFHLSNREGGKLVRARHGLRPGCAAVAGATSRLLGCAWPGWSLALPLRYACWLPRRAFSCCADVSPPRTITGTCLPALACSLHTSLVLLALCAVQAASQISALLFVYDVFTGKGHMPL
jgi:hypothetical protein